MTNLKYSFLCCLLLSLWSCEPTVDTKPDLGSVSGASFDIVAGDTPNEFILKNTTAGAFLSHWDLGDNGSQEGNEVTVSFSFMGTYDVTLTSFSRGGSSSLTKTVTVTQDDPSACMGNLQLLTGCGEKVWKLAAEAGALNVGPSAQDTWWGNSEGDLTDRACHFDDQYIFRVNGEFEYNNNGDFWADSDGNGDIFPAALAISVGCHPSTDWPEAYSAWDSGLHAFNVNDTNLTVSGEGAFIGLYKLGTSGEVDTPQSSVSFSILSLTEERMVLVADYSGVVWRVTLTSN